MADHGHDITMPARRYRNGFSALCPKQNYRWSVVNQAGSVVREGVVDSDPEVISAFVRSNAPM
jgi:hypothetical protein